MNNVNIFQEPIFLTDVTPGADSWMSLDLNVTLTNVVLPMQSNGDSFDTAILILLVNNISENETEVGIRPYDSTTESECKSVLSSNCSMEVYVTVTEGSSSPRIGFWKTANSAYKIAISGYITSDGNVVRLENTLNWISSEIDGPQNIPTNESFETSVALLRARNVVRGTGSQSFSFWHPDDSVNNPLVHNVGPDRSAYFMVPVTVNNVAYLRSMQNALGGNIQFDYIASLSSNVNLKGIHYTNGGYIDYWNRNSWFQTNVFPFGDLSYFETHTIPAGIHVDKIHGPEIAGIIANHYSKFGDDNNFLTEHSIVDAYSAGGTFYFDDTTLNKIDNGIRTSSISLVNDRFYSKASVNNPIDINSQIHWFITGVDGVTAGNDIDINTSSFTLKNAYTQLQVSWQEVDDRVDYYKVTVTDDVEITDIFITTTDDESTSIWIGDPTAADGNFQFGFEQPYGILIEGYAAGHLLEYAYIVESSPSRPEVSLTNIPENVIGNEVTGTVSIDYGENPVNHQRYRLRVRLYKVGDEGNTTLLDSIDEDSSSYTFNLDVEGTGVGISGNSSTLKIIADLCQVRRVTGQSILTPIYDIVTDSDISNNTQLDYYKVPTASFNGINSGDTIHGKAMSISCGGLESYPENVLHYELTVGATGEDSIFTETRDAGSEALFSSIQDITGNTYRYTDEEIVPGFGSADDERIVTLRLKNTSNSDIIYAEETIFIMNRPPFLEVQGIVHEEFNKYHISWNEYDYTTYPMSQVVVEFNNDPGCTQDCGDPQWAYAGNHLISDASAYSSGMELDREYFQVYDFVYGDEINFRIRVTLDEDNNAKSAWSYFTWAAVEYPLPLSPINIEQLPALNWQDENTAGLELSWEANPDNDINTTAYNIYIYNYLLENFSLLPDCAEGPSGPCATLGVWPSATGEVLQLEHNTVYRFAVTTINTAPYFSNGQTGESSIAYNSSIQAGTFPPLFNLEYSPAFYTLGENLSQITAINLTGTTGTADISIEGTSTLTITFNTSLTQTAEDFKILYYGYYATQDITIDFDGDSIVFQADIPGNGFTTYIQTQSGDMSGTVAVQNPNSFTSLGPDTETGSFKIKGVSYDHISEDSNVGQGLSPGLLNSATGSIPQGTFPGDETVYTDEVDIVFSLTKYNILGSGAFGSFGPTGLTGIAGTVGDDFSITIPGGTAFQSSTPGLSDGTVAINWGTFLEWSSTQQVGGLTFGNFYYEQEENNSYLDANSPYTFWLSSRHDFNSSGASQTNSVSVYGSIPSVDNGVETDTVYSFSTIPSFVVEPVSGNISRWTISSGYNPVGTSHTFKNINDNEETTFINTEENYSIGATFEHDEYNRLYSYELTTQNTDDVVNVDKKKTYQARSLPYNLGIGYIEQNESTKVEITFGDLPVGIIQNNNNEIQYAFEFEDTGGGSSGFRNWAGAFNSIDFNSGGINDITSGATTDDFYWIPLQNNETFQVTGLVPFTAYNVNIYVKNIINNIFDPVPVVFDFLSAGPPVLGFTTTDYTNDSLKVTWDNYQTSYEGTYPELSDSGAFEYQLLVSEDGVTFDLAETLNGADSTLSSTFYIQPSFPKYFRLKTKYQATADSITIERKFYNPLHSPSSVLVSNISDDSALVSWFDSTDSDSMLAEGFIESGSLYKLIFTDTSTAVETIYSHTPSFNAWAPQVENISVGPILDFDTEYSLKIQGGLSYNSGGGNAQYYGTESEEVLFTTQLSTWENDLIIPPLNSDVFTAYNFDQSKHRWLLTWTDANVNESSFDVWTVKHPIEDYQELSTFQSIGPSGIQGGTSTIDYSSFVDTGDFILVAGGTYDEYDWIYQATDVGVTFINLECIAEDASCPGLPSADTFPDTDLTVFNVAKIYEIVLGGDGVTGDRQFYIEKTVDGASGEEIDLLPEEWYKFVMRTAVEGATADSYHYSAWESPTSYMYGTGKRMGLAPFINIEISPVEGTTTRMQLTWEFLESGFGSYPITVYIRSDEFENEEYFETNENDMQHNFSDHPQFLGDTSMTFPPIVGGATAHTIEITGYSIGGTGLLIPGDDIEYQLGVHAGYPGSYAWQSSIPEWSEPFIMPDLPDISFTTDTIGPTSLDILLNIEDFGIEFDIYNDWGGSGELKLNGSTALGATAYGASAYTLNGIFSSYSFVPGTEYTFTALPITVDRGATLYEETESIHLFTQPLSASLSIIGEYNNEIVFTFNQNGNTNDSIYYGITVQSGGTQYYMNFDGSLFYPGATPDNGTLGIGGTYGEWENASSGITMGSLEANPLITNTEFTIFVTATAGLSTAEQISAAPAYGSAYTVPNSIGPILTAATGINAVHISIPENDNPDETEYVIQNLNTGDYFVFTNWNPYTPNYWTSNLELAGATIGWINSYSEDLCGETGPDGQDITDLANNTQYTFKAYPIWAKDGTAVTTGSTGISIFTRSAISSNIITTPGNTGMFLEWTNNDFIVEPSTISLADFTQYIVTGSTYTEGELNPGGGGQSAIHASHSLVYPDTTDPKMSLTFAESNFITSTTEELQFWIKNGGTADSRARFNLTHKYTNYFGNVLPQRYELSLEWEGATLSSATATAAVFILNAPIIHGLTTLQHETDTDWYLISLKTEGQHDEDAQITTRELDFTFNNYSEIINRTTIGDGNYTCAGYPSGGATCTYSTFGPIPVNSIVLTNSTGGERFLAQGIAKVEDDVGNIQTLTVTGHSTYTDWFGTRALIEFDPNSWDFSQQAVSVEKNKTIVNMIGPSDFYIFDPQIRGYSQGMTAGATSDFNAVNETTGVSGGFIEGATQYQFLGLTAGTNYEFYIEARNESGLISSSEHVFESTYAIEVDVPLVTNTSPGNIGVEIIDDNPEDTEYAIYISHMEEPDGATSSIDLWIDDDGSLTPTGAWLSKDDWNNKELPNGASGVDAEVNEPNALITIVLFGRTDIGQPPVSSETITINTLSHPGTAQYASDLTGISITSYPFNNNNPSYTEYSVSINQISGSDDPIFGGTTLYLNPVGDGVSGGSGPAYIVGNGISEFGLGASFSSYLPNLAISYQNLLGLNMYELTINSKNFQDGTLSDPSSEKVLSFPTLNEDGNIFSLTSEGIDSYKVDWDISLTNLKAYYNENQIEFTQEPFLFFRTERDGPSGMFMSNPDGATTVEEPAGTVPLPYLSVWENSNTTYTSYIDDNFGNHEIKTSLQLYIPGASFAGIMQFFQDEGEIYTDPATVNIALDGFNGIHPAIGTLTVTTGPAQGFTGYTPNPFLDAGSANWCVDDTGTHTPAVYKAFSNSSCYQNGGLVSPDELKLGTCFSGGSTGITVPEACFGVGTYTEIYNENMPYDYYTWIELYPSGPTTDTEISWNTLNQANNNGITFDVSVYSSYNTSILVDSDIGIGATFTNNYSTILDVPQGATLGISTNGFIVKILATNSEGATSLTQYGPAFPAPALNQWTLDGYTSDVSNIYIHTDIIGGTDNIYEFRLYSESTNQFMGWWDVNNVFGGITFTDENLVSNKEFDYSISVRNDNDWAEPLQSLTGPFYTQGTEDYLISTLGTNYNSIAYTLNTGSNDPTSLYIVSVEDKDGDIYFVDGNGTLGTTYESSAVEKTIEEWNNIIGSSGGLTNLDSGSFYKASLSLKELVSNTFKLYKDVERVDSDNNIISDDKMIKARKFYPDNYVIPEEFLEFLGDFASPDSDTTTSFPYVMNDVIKYKPELFSNDFVFSSEGYIEDKHQRFGNKNPVRKQVLNYTIEDSNEQIYIPANTGDPSVEGYNPFNNGSGNDPWAGNEAPLYAIGISSYKGVHSVLTNSRGIVFPNKAFYYKEDFPLLKNTPWVVSDIMDHGLKAEEFIEYLADPVLLTLPFVKAEPVMFQTILNYIASGVSIDRYITPWGEEFGANQFMVDDVATRLKNVDGIHGEQVSGNQFFLENTLYNLHSFQYRANQLNGDVLTHDMIEGSSADGADYEDNSIDGRWNVTLHIENIGSDNSANWDFQPDNFGTFITNMTFTHTDISIASKGTCTPSFLNKNGDKGVVDIGSSDGAYKEGILTTEENCCEDHAGGFWDDNSPTKCGICLDVNGFVDTEYETESECPALGTWADVLGLLTNVSNFWKVPVEQTNNRINVENIYNTGEEITGYCSSDRVSLRHNLNEYSESANDNLFCDIQTCCEEHAGGSYEPNNEECSGIPSDKDWGWHSVGFEWNQVKTEQQHGEYSYDTGKQIDVSVITTSKIGGAALGSNDKIEVSGTSNNDGIYQISGLLNSDYHTSTDLDLVCKNTSERLQVYKLAGGTMIDESPTNEVTIKAVPKYFTLKESISVYRIPANNNPSDPEVSGLFSHINPSNSWTLPNAGATLYGQSWQHMLGVTFTDLNSADTTYSLKIGKNNYVNDGTMGQSGISSGSLYVSSPITKPIISSNTSFTDESLSRDRVILPTFSQTYNDWDYGSVQISHLNPEWLYKINLEGKTPEFSEKGNEVTFSTLESSWDSSILNLTITKIGGIDVSNIEKVFDISENSGKNPKGNYYYDSDGDSYNDGDVKAIKDLHKNAIQNADYILTAAGAPVPDEWCKGFATLNQALCAGNGGTWKSINDITKITGTLLDGSIEPYKLGELSNNIVNSFTRNDTGSFWKRPKERSGIYQFWNEQRGIRLESYMDPDEFTLHNNLKNIGLWDRITYISIKSINGKTILPKTISNLFRHKPSDYMSSYATGGYMRIASESIEIPSEIALCDWLTYLKIPDSFLSSSVLRIGGNKSSRIQSETEEEQSSPITILNKNSEFSNLNLALSFFNPYSMISGLSESVCDQNPLPFSSIFDSSTGEKVLCTSIDSPLPTCMVGTNQYGLKSKIESVVVESINTTEYFTDENILIQEAERSNGATYSADANRQQSIDMSPLDVNDYVQNFYPDNPFVVTIGSTGILEGPSASPGDPFWVIEGGRTSAINITYGPTFFEGSFDLHLETGVTLTQATIEFTDSVTLTDVTWNESIPNIDEQTGVVVDDEDIVISAEWGLGIPPGNYNFGTVYFTADNQGATTSVCFITNIAAGDTSIEHSPTGAQPDTLGATFIEFGSTCEVLQSATSSVYTMGASALALVYFGDINITNDPNSNLGFSGEFVNVTYTDHDYSLALDYTPYEIESITNDGYNITIYTIEDNFINIPEIPNPGATTTVIYGTFSDNIIHTLTDPQYPLPLYLNGYNDDYLKPHTPYITLHNTNTILEDVYIATNENTFKIYAIPNNLTGVTLDIHYYKTNHSSSTACNSGYVGYELDSSWPFPNYREADILMSEKENMSAFWIGTVGNNNWLGVVKGNAKVYYENQHDTLEDAMDQALPLVGLPCSMDNAAGSPGMEGTCESDASFYTNMGIFYSYDYPQNFIATRTYWRPIILNEEGYVTHMSLNFNGQMKKLHESILNFEYLEVLNLENNGYGSTADIVLYDDAGNAASSTLSDITSLTTIII